MQIQVKAHFNKQTKDSKKELVQFYVAGDDEKRPELNQMTRAVVELSITGVDVKLVAEFKKSSKDSKKTILEFVVKGDTSAAQSYEFYRLAGSDVELSIAESQMSLGEFKENDEPEDEEIEEEDDENQLTMDEVLQ